VHEAILRVSGLSKQYRLGAPTAAYGTLRESIIAAVSSQNRRPDGKKSRNTIWALKDINLEIKPGAVVGIIGRNGAGKSTLLKILSRVTEPTKGHVELYGRVGSLLEVGTGFHPELSGRENIYLNGAILGMRKAEISNRFDEIVAFAELEKFLDTPVKHYSSGMYMRLAFAVAAHLEPEILLVDEVLAVGDSAFQKKCLGKIGEVAQQGRTVLFVSHNMTAVNQLCQHAVLLTNGQVARFGNATEVVSEYLKAGREHYEKTWNDLPQAPGNERVRLRAARIVSNGKVGGQINIDEEVSVEIDFWNHVANIRKLCVDIYLEDETGTTVLSTANTSNANARKENWFEESHPRGLYRAICTLPGNFLNEGRYYISIHIVTLGPLVVEINEPQALSFNVFDTGVMRQPGGGTGKWAGVLRVRLPWRTELIDSGQNNAPAESIL
jgi:lipopolysaccharide transport system ATP-binding protein